MVMLRMPWTITSGLVAVCMLAASILFIVPAEFRRFDNHNVSVQIGLCNFACETIKPNVPVNDSEIYEYWQLPKNVRLSARMVETGKCAVGVIKYNEKRSPKIDESVCYCVHNWWVPVACIVTMGLAFCSILDLAHGIVTRARRTMPIEEVRKRWHAEVVRMIILLLVIVIFALTVQSDFVYTRYGDLYPSEYLHAAPITWQVGLMLFFCATLIRLLVFMILAAIAYRRLGASVDEKKKATGTKAVEPPRPIKTSSRPPAKSLADKGVQTSDSSSDDDTDDSDSSVSSIVIKKARSPPTTVITVCESRGSESGSRASSIMLTAVEDPPSVLVKPESSEGEKDPISLMVQTGDKEKKEETLVFVQSPDRVEVRKQVVEEKKRTSEKK